MGHMIESASEVSPFAWDIAVINVDLITSNEDRIYNKPLRICNHRRCSQCGPVPLGSTPGAGERSLVDIELWFPETTGR